MLNTAYENASSLTIAAPAAANGGVGPKSGDLLLWGNPAGTGLKAMIAATSYTPPLARVTTGNITVAFSGAYYLTVNAKSVLSPATNKAIAPGDPIYADGFTYDATTGVSYGGSLDVNSSSGVYIGNSLDALASGATGTIRVRIG